MKPRTLMMMILPLALILSACSGSGGGKDGGGDADGQTDAADGQTDAGDGQADDAGDGGDADAGGDRQPQGECPFPFAPPRWHTLIDHLGNKLEAPDQQLLCAVEYQDTSAQVLLIAEPTGVQFYDILYQAWETYVCEQGQVRQLAPGTFSFTARHHGWDEMEVAFSGQRYSFGWSEICIGYRPCTASFDVFDVYAVDGGDLLAQARPVTCESLTVQGNPRPLIPQVRVPAEGDQITFSMGSDSGPADEQPVHRVNARPVRMDVRESTWADLALFLNDQGNACGGQACLDISGPGSRMTIADGLFQPEAGFGDHPAVGITWYGANAYCQWRSWRQLPTEAEWELCASAAGGRDYPWGDDPPSCDRALFGACGAPAPEPGCGRPGGNSREEVCDLLGNVAEWISDWYQADYYSTCAAGCSEPQGPDSGTEKVIRGGGFADPASSLRAAARGFREPAAASDSIGVRCVRYTFPYNR